MNPMKRKKLHRAGMLEQKQILENALIKENLKDNSLSLVDSNKPAETTNEVLQLSTSKSETLVKLTEQVSDELVLDSKKEKEKKKKTSSQDI